MSWALDMNTYAAPAREFPADHRVGGTCGAGDQSAHRQLTGMSLAPLIAGATVTVRAAESALDFTGTHCEPFGMVSAGVHLRIGELDYECDRPTIDDGAAIWWLVSSAGGGLDLNSPYAYLLWCRDFADTSVVVRCGAAVVGVTTGFVRPGAPDTIMVWQQAVCASHRRRGLGTLMVAELLARSTPGGIRYLEATVGPTNAAPVRTLEHLAHEHHSRITRRPLFPAGVFPTAADHPPEILIRVGPLQLASAGGSGGNR